MMLKFYKVNFMYNSFDVFLKHRTCEFPNGNVGSNPWSQNPHSMFFSKHYCASAINHADT
jgi:hypothetical protein